MDLPRLVSTGLLRKRGCGSDNIHLKKVLDVHAVKHGKDNAPIQLNIDTALL